MLESGCKIFVYFHISFPRTTTSYAPSGAVYPNFFLSFMMSKLPILIVCCSEKDSVEFLAFRPRLPQYSKKKNANPKKACM